MTLLPTALRAEPPNLFQLRASVGYEHNDNVLQVPSGNKPDDITSASVGIAFDKTYSLQRFRLDAEQATYRYRNFSELNYSTTNYLAAWDWSWTPRFHGVLSAEQRQARDVSDTITGGGVAIVGRRTEQTELLEGTYDIDGAWRVQGGIGHTRSSTTVPLSWDSSPDINSARVGAGYEFASGSSLFARYRHGDGTYTAVLPGVGFPDFKEDEADLVGKWAYSGKTNFGGRLGYLKRTHDGAPQRDFSGAVGGAYMNWEATGKTRVITGVSRDLGTAGLDTGGFVVSDRFYIGPDWAATAHVTVNARYDRIWRRWKDVSGTSNLVGRSDSIDTASVGVDWHPRQWVTLSAMVRSERVQTNFPGGGYRNTAYGVLAKFYFL
jgi:exopolysaccharide biosynthesis operon protein EpsL